MTVSPKLALPYLEAAQSQKHVTVNESLRLLDAIVQLSVKSMTVTAPPGSPANGDAYIVPPSATGTWAGWDGSVALYADTAWLRIVPGEGWIAWVQSTDGIVAWNGTAWASPLGFSDIPDTSFSLVDNGDATKKAKFELSGIATGTTRTFTLPDANGVLALVALAQTLQNKTLDNTNTATLKDTLFTLQDDGDATKQAAFQLSGITTGNTRTLTVPDASGTLALLSLAQTWSQGQVFNGANNTLGQTTGSTSVTHIATGAATSGITKTVNIGGLGLSGSTTNVNIGSAVAGALGTLTINSPTVTFASTVSAVAMAAANLSALYCGLGGATADATNRFSINSPASLFNHASNGHQLKINKNASTDTASILMQDGFSGRLEIGLTGSDDTQVKVSNDGSTWYTALQLERTTGRVRAMQSLGIEPRASAPGSPADGDVWYDSTLAKFRARENGSTVDLRSGGAGSSFGVYAFGVLQSAYTLTNTLSAQKAFNWSTNGALTLVAGTYKFSCGLLLSSLSATSESVTFDPFGAGSATVGKYSWYDYGLRSATVNGIGALSGSSGSPAGSGKLTSAGTPTAMHALVEGVFELTAGGTIIPTITLAIAAAAVVNVGSFFECVQIGAAATLTGTWS